MAGITEEYRDYQVSAIYAAEWAAHECAPFLISCKPKSLIGGAVGAFLAPLEQDTEIMKRFGAKKIHICAEYSEIARSKQTGRDVHLAVRKRGMCGYEVLHEVAHVICDGVSPAHGSIFASVFLFLVKQSMPEKNHRALHRQFVKHQIQFINI